MENFTKEELKNFFIGLTVIITCILLSIIYKVQKNAWEGQEDSDYTLFATFNRTDGLVIGDKVRMAGIDIGRVIDAQLDENFRSTLSFSIDSDIKIPDDSSVSIVSSGITGSKYVEVDPGGSEEFLEPEGKFIYTQDAMILEELIDRIISIGKANRKKECDPKDKNDENVENEQSVSEENEE